MVAVDHASPQCASAIASVNPRNPIQKSVRRSALENGAVPRARPPKPIGATIGERDGQPEEGERDGRRRSSTVSRIDDVGGAVHRVRGEEHQSAGGHAGVGTTSEVGEQPPAGDDAGPEQERREGRHARGGRRRGVTVPGRDRPERAAMERPGVEPGQHDQRELHPEGGVRDPLGRVRARTWRAPRARPAGARSGTTAGGGAPGRRRGCAARPPGGAGRTSPPRRPAGRSRGCA